MPAIPLKGDRSAWDSLNYPELHASDLFSGCPVNHLPTITGSGIFVYSASGSMWETLTLAELASMIGDSGSSGSIVADDGWRIGLTQNETANDSDKTFTIPADIEWQILWIWAEYTSSSNAGLRQLEIQMQDSGSNVIGQFQTGIAQAENSTFKYLFGIAVPDLTDIRDGNYLMTPMPAGTFLSEGQKVRIWDNKAIDAAADDMLVQMQYAYRQAGDLIGSSIIKELFITLSGSMVVHDNPFRFYNKTGASETISQIFLSVGTAPTSASIVVDIHKSGTTIFTNQDNRPAILGSLNTGFSTSIDVPAWSDGEYLTTHIDSCGLTNSGSDLVVHIIYS